MSHRDEAEKALKEVLMRAATMVSADIHTNRVNMSVALDPDCPEERKSPELEDALHRFTYHMLEAASERDKGPIIDGRG